MNCNIIVIYNSAPSEPEAIDTANALAQRYQARKVVILNDINNLSDLDGIDQLLLAGSCGVYLVSHGSDMFGLLGNESDQFARLISNLYDKHLPIKKICIVACQGVRCDDNANVVQVMNTSQDKSMDCFVQNICVELTKVIHRDTLTGLMIAGYVTPVFVFTPDGHVHNRSFKTSPKTIKNASSLTPGSKVFRSDNLNHMRPTIPGNFQGALSRDFEAALKAYIARKIIFVFKDGGWTMGSLMDYTDSAAMKDALRPLLGI